MSEKISYFVFGIIVAVLIGTALYFVTVKKSGQVVSNTNTVSTTIETVTIPNNIEYKDSHYGFWITLPKSWERYSVFQDEWEGYSLTEISLQGQVVTEHGPLISLRHPDWTDETPRQDIPIMVFTLKQWGDLQVDKFHIGAAPIGPSELGRNSKYVFAVPARYNYAFPTGFEEVDELIKGDNLKTF